MKITTFVMVSRTESRRKQKTSQELVLSESETEEGRKEQMKKRKQI